MKKGCEDNPAAPRSLVGERVEFCRSPFQLGACPPPTHDRTHTQQHASKENYRSRFRNSSLGEGLGNKGNIRRTSRTPHAHKNILGYMR